MRQIKSERLKKLEQELTDLEQWLKLGLVPKNDLERHKEEISVIQSKIEEEKERLQFLKESGETTDTAAPKRQPARAGYTEMPSIPDIDISESQTISDSTFDNETDHTESDTSIIEEKDEETEDATYVEDEEESFFSDRNRWRRGFKDIIDPEANEW